MGQRLDLQTVLEGITPNVYFQPPRNLDISYPCIIYARDYANTEFADNAPYNILKRYQVTVVERNPDSSLPDEVAKLPTASFSTHFTKDNLHHDVYTLFF